MPHTYTQKDIVTYFINCMLFLQRIYYTQSRLEMKLLSSSLKKIYIAYSSNFVFSPIFMKLLNETKSLRVLDMIYF